jgi:hypothetical protein
VKLPGGSFTAVLGGAALLMLSAFAPWALFRLLPFVEAGAVGHLEGLSRQARSTGSAPVRSLAHTAMQKSSIRAVDASGSAMVGRALTGPLGGGGSRGGSSGGPGGGAASSGDGGLQDSGPDLGPSSAETTGVGTMGPPGGGIPLYPIDDEVTAVANRAPAPAGDRTGSAGSDRSGAGSSPVGPELVPLPRATGALRPAHLGRDRLGIKLIDPSQAPPERSDE